MKTATVKKDKGDTIITDIKIPMPPVKEPLDLKAEACQIVKHLKNAMNGKVSYDKQRELEEWLGEELERLRP